MSETVSVGFLGVGALMTKQHLPNAHRNPRFRVHTLCDLDAGRVSHYGERYGAVKTTADYETMLNDAEIDLIVIAVRPEEHARLAIESLRAGKHVYVEKPLGEDSDSAMAVARAVEETGKRLAVGYNRRFAPAYRDVAEMVTSDKGPIMLSYRMVDDERDRPAWYRGRPRLLDEACHVFDLFNWLARSTPVSVFATAYGREGDNHVIVEYENGVSAALTMSSHGAFAWPKERLEVVGDNKVIGVEDFVELQAAGVAGVTRKNYKGREYDGFTKGYAEGYERGGIEFYREMRRMSADLLLGSNVISEYPEREKWEVVAEKYPEHVRIPINYSCDKGWYDALDHFGECAMSGARPRNAGARDGAITAATALAAMASLEQRTPVEVDASLWAM